MRQLSAGGLGKGEALGAFDILTTLQLKDTELPAIVPPDLGNTESRENWQLIQGRAGDLDFDHQVRGWINGGVDVNLAVHPRGALDVETHVGLESTLKLAAFEGRRAEVLDVDPQSVGQHLDQQAQRLFVPFVFCRRAHDLQHPTVESETGRRGINVVGKKMPRRPVSLSTVGCWRS